MLKIFLKDWVKWIKIFYYDWMKWKFLVILIEVFVKGFLIGVEGNICLIGVGCREEEKKVEKVNNEECIWFYVFFMKKNKEIRR